MQVEWKQRLLWLGLVLLSIGQGGPAWGMDLGGGLTISNVTYMDFTLPRGDSFEADTPGLSSDQANTNLGRTQGFHFTRVYLNFIKQFEEKPLVIRITTDQMTFLPNGDSQGTPLGLTGFGGAGRGELFIKFAYAQYTFTPAAVLRVGLQQTPWLDWFETRYTYRFLGPTFTDTQGLLTSSDMGVGLLGSIPGGWLQYQVLFSNGEGYQNNSIDGRGFMGSGRINANFGPLTLAVFGATGRSQNGNSAYDPKREIVAVIYSNTALSLGADYLLADDTHRGVEVMTTYDSTAGSAGPKTSGRRFQSARGYHVWGFVRIPPVEPARLYADFYRMKPNDDTDAGTWDQLRFGASYDLGPGLVVALDQTFHRVDLLDTNTGRIDALKNQATSLRAMLTF